MNVVRLGGPAAPHINASLQPVSPVVGIDGVRTGLVILCAFALRIVRERVR